MNFTDFRLKFRRFFRANKRLFLVIIIIWAIIFFINMILTNLPEKPVPTTTYEAHTSVISSSSTPNSMKDPIEDMINNYVECCNEGNYQKAFDMLSEDCKKYEFDNSIINFMDHVLTKIPTQKKHAIQSYSKVNRDNRTMYIYEVKYTDDFLATGLTNADYGYTQENMTFYKKDNIIEMNVGNYMYHTDVKSISENEYLKIDVIDKIVHYSMETYEVKFTNRSNYTVVVADGEEADEVILALKNETRKSGALDNIVLSPKQSLTIRFEFPKFIDDNDISRSLMFPGIRVMEKYSGTEVEDEIKKSEIDNAIAKFSMEVVVEK